MQQTSITTPRASRKAAPIALAHNDMRRNFFLQFGDQKFGTRLANRKQGRDEIFRRKEAFGLLHRLPTASFA